MFICISLDGNLAIPIFTGYITIKLLMYICQTLFDSLYRHTDVVAEIFSGLSYGPVITAVPFCTLRLVGVIVFL